MNKLLDFLKGLFGNGPKWLKIIVSIIVGLFVALACANGLASCITLDGQGEIHVRPVCEEDIADNSSYETAMSNFQAIKGVEVER